MAVLIQKIQPSRIIDTLLQARVDLCVLAFLLSGLNLFLQFLKWRYLVRLIKPDVPASEILTSLFAGFTFGLITPGRVGEFGRVVFIKNKPYITLLGLSFLDKFYALALVFLGGSIGLLAILGQYLDQHVLFWPVVLFAIVSLSLLFYLILHPDAIRTLLYSLNITLPFREKIKLLISSLDNFHHRQAHTLLALCSMFYFVLIGQFYVLVLAFKSISAWPAYQAISATLFVKTLLPISLGDLGIRELAAKEFFSFVGVYDAAAFNASLLLFTINVLLPSIIGLFFILKNNITNGK